MRANLYLIKCIVLLIAGLTSYSNALRTFDSWEELDKYMEDKYAKSDTLPPFRVNILLFSEYDSLKAEHVTGLYLQADDLNDSLKEIAKNACKTIFSIPKYLSAMDTTFSHRVKKNFPHYLFADSVSLYCMPQHWFTRDFANIIYINIKRNIAASKKFKLPAYSIHLIYAPSTKDPFNSRAIKFESYDDYLGDIASCLQEALKELIFETDKFIAVSRSEDQIIQALAFSNTYKSDSCDSCYDSTQTFRIQILSLKKSYNMSDKIRAGDYGYFISTRNKLVPRVLDYGYDPICMPSKCRASTPKNNKLSYRICKDVLTTIMKDVDKAFEKIDIGENDSSVNLDNYENFQMLILPTGNPSQHLLNKNSALVTARIFNDKMENENVDQKSFSIPVNGKKFYSMVSRSIELFKGSETNSYKYYIIVIIAVLSIVPVAYVILLKRKKHKTNPNTVSEISAPTPLCNVWPFIEPDTNMADFLFSKEHENFLAIDYIEEKCIVFWDINLLKRDFNNLPEDRTLLRQNYSFSFSDRYYPFLSFCLSIRKEQVLNYILLEKYKKKCDADFINAFKKALCTKIGKLYGLQIAEARDKKVFERLFKGTFSNRISFEISRNDIFIIEDHTNP